ncbi:DUF4405 domain-containing protein [Candidatus Pacearchaeota archaeon]|nr:DUF4405 domain-containing protein [Candidatus Pacearchaeota archaeon]
MVKNKVKLWVDIVMFLDLLVVALSGFILWFVYPAGKHSGSAGVKFLFDRFKWLEIHNWVTVIFIILLLVHWTLNFAWIKSMLRFKKKVEPQKGVIPKVNVEQSKPVNLVK